VTDVQSLLGLSKPPVAVAYLDAPPPGLDAWDGGAVPAGCFFWKKAAEGRSFYTTPADHYNCAVGAHVHAIPLPVERGGELEQTVGFMVETGYLAMEEVPGIPTLPKTPAAIAYGPVGSAPFAPDVVIVAARPAQAMLLYEAAIAAGAGGALMNALGRPGCAVEPLALGSGSAALSFGCKGNRTFTGLPDDEMYLCVPGDRWEAVAAQVARLHRANADMGAYYAGRKALFTVS
jgi:uncharacterized protein (DUF169 family)